MTDKTTEPTPTLLALELKGFAEGVQALAETIDNAAHAYATVEHERTPEDREKIVRAEQAAHAMLRNSPAAVRTIRRLEGCAEKTVERSTDRRDAIMTSMFGPDTT